jgi:hypothetical protein
VTGHGIAPIRGIDGAARAAPAPRQAPALRAVPSEPPPALTLEYQAAARVIEQMAASQVNLHFEIDEGNRVHVQILDKNGQLIREIPARNLLDSLSASGLPINQRI